MKSSRYNVIIDPVDSFSDDGTLIERVLEYKHEGAGVFYVAGVDFEQWFILHPGQIVTVTEEGA